MQISKVIVPAILAGLLSACGTTDVNTIAVQNATAQTLGLASSDEVSITNVQYEKKNALGGTLVTYDATTSRGRRFNCEIFMIPGLTVLDRPSYNDGSCSPAKGTGFDRQTGRGRNKY